MVDEAFVDTHVHFWDPASSGLRWDWLSAGSTPYLPSDLAGESAGVGLAAVVCVHSADPLPNPVEETRWVDRLARAPGGPAAIVGRCELAPAGAAQMVQQHAEASTRLRSVRDLAAAHHLIADQVAPAMKVAQTLGLSVELRRPHTDVGPLIEVARQWPDVTITLSHACLPPGRDPSELAAWSAAMSRLAAEPNVVCKISAVIDTSERGWDARLAAPWVLEAIGAFGADRCMIGSNWPLDRRIGPYRALVDMYREITSGCSSAERAALFQGTANRVYDISPNPA